MLEICYAAMGLFIDDCVGKIPYSYGRFAMRVLDFFDKVVQGKSRTRVAVLLDGYPNFLIRMHGKNSIRVSDSLDRFGNFPNFGGLTVEPYGAVLVCNPHAYMHAVQSKKVPGVFWSRTMYKWQQSHASTHV